MYNTATAPTGEEYRDTQRSCHKQQSSWKLLVATKTLVGGISDQDEDFLGDLIRRGSMLTLNVRFKNFIHTTAKNIKPAFSTSVANIFDGVFFFFAICVPSGRFQYISCHVARTESKEIPGHQN